MQMLEGWVLVHDDLIEDTSPEILDALWLLPLKLVQHVINGILSLFFLLHGTHLLLKYKIMI